MVVCAGDSVHWELNTDKYVFSSRSDAFSFKERKSLMYFNDNVGRLLTFLTTIFLVTPQWQTIKINIVLFKRTVGNDSNGCMI